MWTDSKLWPSTLKQKGNLQYKDSLPSEEDLNSIWPTHPTGYKVNHPALQLN